MMRFTAFLLLFVGSAFSVEQTGKPGVPTFAVAFHLNEFAETRAETLNKQSTLGHLPFSEKLSGVIHSDGVRIGGEHLVLKGTYYDEESQSIMHVGGGVEISGPNFSFTNFPPGDYLLNLDVQGSSIYSRHVRLPFSEGEEANFKIEISKAVVISGTIDNIPVWALESPLAGIGSSLSVIDKMGSFKLASYSRVEDKITVKVRFSNPYQKDWEQPLYRFEFNCERPSSLQPIKLPEIGNWKTAEGRVRFSDKLPVGLKPVLQNISIIAASDDDKLIYRCNPDTNGNFMLVGLPDGKYTVEVDDFGNPPFITERLIILVKDHASSPLDLVLDTHVVSK
jgi:hypothetical protein